MNDPGRFLDGFEVPRRSTAEQVAEDLRELILSGEFSPGAAVREQAVSERLRVSRQAVREAIQRLAQAGLLVHVPFKGTVVRTLTVADAGDIYRLRLLVELAALDAAIAGPPAVRTAISQAAEGVAAALRHETYRASLEADFAMHLAIVRALDSPRAEALYESLFGESLLLFSLSDRAEYPSADAARRHREIADAIEARDRDLARALLTAHLEESRAHAQRQIELGA